jgi:hypothetical protein
MGSTAIGKPESSIVIAFPSCFFTQICTGLNRKLAVRPKFSYNTAISLSADLPELYKIYKNQ